MFPLSSLILSSQFWPAFKNDTIELPEELKKVFDRYTKSYEAYKGNRTLFWRPFIGRVDLEIEVGNKKLDLSVSPIHAVIIHEFQKKSKLVDFMTCLELSHSNLLTSISVRFMAIGRSESKDSSARFSDTEKDCILASTRIN